MLTDSHIESLEIAELKVREAKALYDNTRLLREREIRRIAAEGGTYREIGHASGVTYQRVAQIVTGHEPPTRDQFDHLEFECPKCGARPGEKCEGKHASYQSHIERDWLAIEAFREKHPELG